MIEIPDIAVAGDVAVKEGGVRVRAVGEWKQCFAGAMSAVGYPLGVTWTIPSVTRGVSSLAGIAARGDKRATTVVSVTRCAEPDAFWDAFPAEREIEADIVVMRPDGKEVVAATLRRLKQYAPVVLKVVPKPRGPDTEKQPRGE